MGGIGRLKRRCKRYHLFFNVSLMVPCVVVVRYFLRVLASVLLRVGVHHDSASTDRLSGYQASSGMEVVDRDLGSNDTLAQTRVVHLYAAKSVCGLIFCCSPLLRF